VQVQLERTEDIMTTKQSKVAIVTGAARGIGAEVARRLARDGFAVVLDYGGSADAANKLAAEITAAGGQALPFAADVSDPAAVAQLFAAAESWQGGVDVLVNNAGIMTLSSVAETDAATFRRMIAINLEGTFNTLREASRRLRRGGRIINFSSSVIGLQLPTYAAYAATKAGVEALTVVLAKELRGKDITVNTVAPGPTATDLFLKGKPAEVVERMSKAAPLERLGQPSDIASVVSFLAGPDGAWVNGQTLRANGGVI
jgi:3-oxoacyl-[acyl-carrier protein] reductase